MKRHLASLGMTLLLTAGCSSTGPQAPTGQQAAAKPPLSKTYTDKERAQMTYCIGLSDTARRAATEKLKGTPIEEVKKLYAAKPNERVNAAAVDKVYSDPVSTAWDYTVAFFGTCAKEMAGVPSERVQFASYCMQNQLMAEVAHAYKSTGKPKEQAYAHFAQFKSTTPKTIVDWVYASPKERTAIRMEVWNTCMAEVSAA